MRRPWAWAVGGLALAGLLRRRRDAAVGAVDPRADELRVKLAESRSTVEEREVPAPEDAEARRRAVHESARATVAQMRKR
ncbi:MAG TPA: hypothetical protein VLB89_01200 [Gaiellaceae bacterium]|nr:hypothetical protein [Gaiellaceae bacterium]